MCVTAREAVDLKEKADLYREQAQNAFKEMVELRKDFNLRMLWTSVAAFALGVLVTLALGRW